MYCIYHSRDLDGWMSAAIVSKWADENSLPVTMIPFDYGNSMPDITKGEKVIMVDVSWPMEAMIKLNKDNDLIWIDHHISAIKDADRIFFEGLRDVKFSACELTWKYFYGDKIPEFVRLLGRYDCFGHKGTPEEQKVLEFQYAARVFYKNPKDCLVALKASFDKQNMYPSYTSIDWLLQAGRTVYKHLCTEAEQSYPLRSNHQIGNKKIAAVNKARFNPINFGIDYHKDGYDVFLSYFFDGKKWSYSLYNDDGKTDVSIIAKQFGGGGHAGAAGFISDNIDFLFPNK